MRVRCGGCGSRFDLAATNARRYRREGREPRCRTCRRKPREVDEAERAKLVEWWIAKLGEREARELARTIWAGYEPDSASQSEALTR